MKTTAIFYSYNSTNTASSAKLILNEFPKGSIEEVNMEELNDEQFTEFDNMILGVPTWFDGELPNYWDEFVPAIEDMSLKGKKVAIFGHGDQKNYSENFCDGVGIMASLLASRGAEIVGITPVEGYNFESSAAIKDGVFQGLLLDNMNQKRKTASRIKSWAEQIKKEFK